MRYVFGLALLSLWLGAASSGAAGSPEGTTKKLIAAVNNVAAIMETIHDESSATDALPKLNKAAASAGELRREMDAYKLSEAERRQLRQKYQKAADDARTRMNLATLLAIKKAPRQRSAIVKVLRKTIKGKS